VATRFETWHFPNVTAGPAAAGGARLRVFIRPDALDHSLARIASGRATFALYHNHQDDGPPLVTSAAGCLTLRHLGDRLELHVRANNAAGRKALAALWVLPDRELSVGLRKVHGIGERVGDQAFMMVTSAVLEEISIVPRGAVPRCRLRFKES
jgi:hypothetical protein